MHSSFNNSLSFREFDQKRDFDKEDFNALVDRALKTILGQGGPTYSISTFDSNSRKGSVIVEEKDLHLVWGALSIYAVNDHVRVACSTELDNAHGLIVSLLNLFFVYVTLFKIAETVRYQSSKLREPMETILFAVFIGLPILFVLILLLLVYLSLPKRIPFYFNGKHALVTGRKLMPQRDGQKVSAMASSYIDYALRERTKSEVKVASTDEMNVNQFFLWSDFRLLFVATDLTSLYGLHTDYGTERASKGIGKEVAFTLITRGCSVSLIARSIGPLKAAVSEMNTYAHSIQSRAVARYFVLDVSQEYHVIEATVKRIVDEVGPIDVLINNAGTCCQGAFDSLPICEFEAQLKINYLSSVYVTRAVLPYMKESRSGSISFVCTAAAQCPIWGYTAYSASKGALRCFAESLRMEMLPLGIGVCIIYPANTDTEGFQEELKTTPDVVRALSSSAGLLSAKSVAVCLLDNIAVGNATAYVGLQGWILGLLSAGGASESSFFQSSLQVLFGGLLRAVMLISIGNFNEIVHKCLKN